MKKLFICTVLVCFIGLGFYACDSTTSSRDLLSDSPAIISLNISPKSIQFTEEEHGFRDTTVSLQIQFNTKNITEQDILSYSLSPKNDETIAEGTIDVQEPGAQTYTETIDLETTTTTIQDFVVNVFVNNRSGDGNYAQSVFKVVGFSNFPPEIVETTSPGTITRPSSGSTPAVFTATVTDADGDDTIDRVLLRIIDQETGEVNGSPFDMADDGMSLGDETANDLTYTLSFDVPADPTSGRIERDYDIEFFAVDRGGLYSDTLRTTFHIKGN